MATRRNLVRQEAPAVDAPPPFPVPPASAPTHVDVRTEIVPGVVKTERVVAPAIPGVSHTVQSISPGGIPVISSEKSENQEARPATEKGPISLVERVLQVMKEVEYVQKREKTTDLKYAPVAAADVIAAVRPAMIRAGLVLVPTCVRELPSTVVKTKFGEMTCVHAVFTFILSCGELRASTLEVEVVASGADQMDKGFSKALTMAHKQALLKIFQIETGEEDFETRSERDDAPPPEGAAEFIAQAEFDELLSLIGQAQVEEAVVCQSFGIQKLEDMVQSDFPAAKARLEQRIKNMAGRGAPAAQ